jgi:hypothetical protein
VCDSSNQAAHCHHLGPKLGASFLTWHFGWKQNKKVKKKKKKIFLLKLISKTSHCKALWLTFSHPNTVASLLSEFQRH